MIKTRTTPHQRWALLRLVRLSTLMLREGQSRLEGRWVLAKDCGAPGALDHLYRKGLLDRRIEIGPRGGEHVLYKPNEIGLTHRDHVVFNDLKVY